MNTMTLSGLSPDNFRASSLRLVVPRARALPVRLQSLLVLTQGPALGSDSDFELDSLLQTHHAGDPDRGLLPGSSLNSMIFGTVVKRSVTVIAIVIAMA